MRPLDRVISALGPRRLPLAAIELLTVELPLVESFRSAVGGRESRRALLVRWRGGADENGDWGLAECACRPDPYFSAEYLEAAAALLRDHLVPRLADGITWGELADLAAPVRGWPFAKAALLDAACDLMRRRGETGPLELWRQTALDRVPAGISLGLYDDAAVLADRAAAAAAEGYRRIKLKVRPGLPTGYLERTREALPERDLAVDANGSFDGSHLDELAALEGLALAFAEQPFAPDRLDLSRALAARAPRLRLCLDESVESAARLDAAWRLAALDELNLKPGRVGGELAAIEVAEKAAALGIPVWVGGMFETGIGRAANLRLAARLPEARAHDLSPSRRYFERDLVAEPAEMDGAGTVGVPTGPPRIVEDRLERFLISREVLSPARGRSG